LISIGITPATGRNEAQDTEDVKNAVLRFLAPTAGERQRLPDDPATVLAAASSDVNGWKLGKSVRSAELAAVANRTGGVDFVRGAVLLAGIDGGVTAEISMTGLELPRIRGIRVTSGDPISIAELQTGTPALVVVDPSQPSVAGSNADVGTPVAAACGGAVARRGASCAGSSAGAAGNVPRVR
jgi:hypothetical protein